MIISRDNRILNLEATHAEQVEVADIGNEWGRIFDLWCELREDDEEFANARASKPQMRKLFEKWVNERKARRHPKAIFVATRNGSDVPIGYARVDILDSGQAVLGGLIVTRVHRRKGIGQLLLNAVLEWLSKHSAAQHVKTLRLTVLGSNDTAVQFYKRLGFEITEVIGYIMDRPI